MDWDKYKTEFRYQAKEKEYTEEEIDSYLVYAKNLVEHGLPIIYDQNHVAMLVGYDIGYLLAASNAPVHFYRNFTIPKKSGGERSIDEPLPSLKEIQKWILRNLLERIKVSQYAKAYTKKHSIKENARFHRNQRKVLTLDIRNFFGSIRVLRVIEIYKHLGYSNAVAVMLGNLCCLNSSVPQGAPTSPYISNIIMKRADARIGGFCTNHRIRFTRYADDLSFSGDFNAGYIIKFVRKILKDEQLFLNEDKTRLMKQHKRQEVTGVVVNKKLQAPINLRRMLRQSVYYIRKYGLVSHLEKTRNYRANYVRHLLGISNFICFLNPDDKEADYYKDYLKRIAKSS